MHIHILGICGTFMGGIAAIARQAGFRVTGSDQKVYPPMSDQLRALDIDIIEGFGVEQLDLKPDLIVIGNVMSRGMPIIEEILSRKLPFCSAPQWLYDCVLKDRHVIAVSGTHGKTTTTSMVSWILEHAGYNPGYLVGGVPANFDVSARLGSDPFFVIEADEYDTAFFNKQAKFLNYRPNTLIVNNIEFDHADIYKDIDAILWQFHQLLRMLPANGNCIALADDAYTDQLLEMGCWTPVTRFVAGRSVDGWSAERSAEDQLAFYCDGELRGECYWPHPGEFNIENALAALLAVTSAGVGFQASLDGLATFRGVKRRMELLGDFGGVRLYDDFAHHPTAIERSLEGMKQFNAGRVLAVLEPRSNTMKMGAHADQLSAAIAPADKCWVMQPDGMSWSLSDVLDASHSVKVMSSADAIVASVVEAAKPGDAIVIMSNGSFDGIYGKFRSALSAA
ncbi:MAG: UDP-N-acetylmuramate:L-alanyl-gamma-D-glutamyl-meso-diaminopimelate ligase [Chromatiales bacterium]|jgi:UDP-N-acetylmuramate: L-alanyl-gamma-D-glutamyl-meso-diaminopimelate ligase|nr:UDP-N-acetylmuramate:L-alanyl-gamma-D-glutamyl-meso-diaminopimelate ligase [Chromatiales bacterium]